MVHITWSLDAAVLRRQSHPIITNLQSTIRDTAYGNRIELGADTVAGNQEQKGM
jgi:hypothetical protein